MKVHELKIKEVYYERIISGSKDFEVRFNDRDYQVGDELLLVPINRDSLVVDRTPIRAKIKYIHSGLGMAEGYIVIGIDVDHSENKNRCPNCLQAEPNYYCERCRP